MTLYLSGLISYLTEKNLLVRSKHCEDAATIALYGIDHDSRIIEPGHVFVCKGAAFKPEFLKNALETGAVAYLCAESHAAELEAIAPTVPALIATDANLRRAMAEASAYVTGHPDHGLTMIGITGTKGKSTTACMLRAILDGDEPYEKAAIMGSIEVFDGIEHGKPDNTTPEAPELWRHLANAQKCGLTYMAMEVSSQALKYDRTYGLHLDIAVFLNIGRDHISPVEHPTFEDYFSSKMKIFDMAKTAVINRDTEHYEDVMAHVRAAHERNPECCQHVYTFSATNPKADIWADDISSEYGLVSFRAHTPTWTGHLSIPMPGLFNVDNALAAITVANLLGFSGEKLQYPLLNTHVSGRMELIPTKDRKVTALVDYAHNRLAYQKLFSSSSQEFPNYGRYVVLGAVGGKAQERRRDLPEEGSKWADHLIYTTEDPAFDDPAEICAEMAAATPKDASYEIILDREEAIRQAVRLAYADARPSIVYLLAKGDEDFQSICGKRVPWKTDAAVFKAAVRDHETGRL